MYTVEEVAKHNSPEDSWLILQGKVYDITEFIEQHPGGTGPLQKRAGTDGQEGFDNAFHNQRHLDTMAKYLLGSVVAEAEATPPASPSNANTAVPTPTPPTAGTCTADITLVEKRVESHDSYRFTFAIKCESEGSLPELGLKPGQNMRLTAEIEGEKVSRKYTPITVDEERKEFVIVVKVYRGLEATASKETLTGQARDRIATRGRGVFSTYLEDLSIGSTVHAEGPWGELHRIGAGGLSIGGTSRAVSNIGMIAAGSGITPIFRLLVAILDDPEDHSEVVLIYANHSCEDILLRSELTQLREAHPERFKLHHFLSDCNPGGEENGAQERDESITHARICRQSISEILPPPGEGVIQLLCGPPAMVQGTCKPLLKELGFQEADVFAF
ncbi:unnamed protein product [Chrysoparadoxa australica]